MRRTGALALAVIILVAGLAASAGAADLNIKFTYTGTGRGATPTSYDNATITISITEQKAPSASGILFKGTMTLQIGTDTFGPFPLTGQMSVRNIWHATMRDGQTGAVKALLSGEFSAITWTLKGVLQDPVNGETWEFSAKR